jgi:hypothetical protein
MSGSGKLRIIRRDVNMSGLKFVLYSRGCAVSRELATGYFLPPLARLVESAFGTCESINEFRVLSI